MFEGNPADFAIQYQSACASSAGGQNIRIFDIFAGVGGLSCGFKQIGGSQVVSALEIDPDACATYRVNHHNPVLEMDIRGFSGNMVSDIGGVDLVVGGPPCQAYSSLGKRDETDPRAWLFQEYGRVLSLLNPTAFIFENVRGMVGIDDGRIFEAACAYLRSKGYRISVEVLNAADFGVPQNRERVIVVGSRLGEFAFPKRTHAPSDVAKDLGLLPYTTVRQAIGSLPPPSEDGVIQYRERGKTDLARFLRGVDGDGRLTDHKRANHSQEMLDLMASIPEGRFLADRPGGMGRKGFANSYGRLWWDRPCTTITRNSGTPSGARCIHPSENRALTVREAARIQTFPDTFHFTGSTTSKRVQVGNAVPPMMACKLAEAMRIHLKSAA